MKIIARLAILTVMISATLGCDSDVDGFPEGTMRVGGLEPISVDGKQYFFAYNFTSDRVLTPLFPSDEAAADYAASHLVQRDGRHDRNYWIQQARDALRDPSLTDPPGQAVSLKPFRDALRNLRQDKTTGRTLPDLVIPEYLGYLLEMNCEWPDTPIPAEIEQAAVRLGLAADDTSPWLEESTSILTGKSATPSEGTFQDAASVFIWYFDTLLRNQRHGWSHQLGLTPGAA